MKQRNRRKNKPKNGILVLNKKIIISCLIFLLCIFVPTSYAAIKIKLLAINPSDTQKQKVPIRYNLPKEVRKEDVIDTGTMSVEYDAKNATYYLYKEVELEPKASVTFQVIMQDKWEIPPEQLESLKKNITDKLKTLEGSDQYETAKMLADKLLGKVDDMVTSQNQAAGDIAKKIEVNRLNRQIMEQMDGDVHSMEYLARIAKAGEEAGTIKFIIEADNPSDAPMETRITHYLPKEILSENIVDKSGFEAGYDRDAGQYYLWKNEKFQPKEKKRYEVEIKDIWHISIQLLESYKKDADIITQKLSTTKYKDMANTLYNDIIKYTEDIQTSQNEAVSLKDRISLYPINSERETRVRQAIERLKIMLGDIAKEVSLSPKPAEQVHNVLRQIKALDQLRLLSEAVVKKFIPKTEVWRVISDVVIFTILFTILVTVLWIMRLRVEDSRTFKKVEKQESEKIK